MSTLRTDSVTHAATVVIARDGKSSLEILLVKRAAAISVYGGAWVFPGGKLDPQDAPDSPLPERMRQAACREVIEEAGIHLNSNELIHISHWTSPADYAKRFATWFFLAAGNYQDVIIDNSEIQDFRWITPRDAIAAQGREEIELAPATFVTLCTLSDLSSIRKLKEMPFSQPEIFEPKTFETVSGKVSLYAGDAGYTSGDFNCPGPRHRLDMRTRPFVYECNMNR